MSGRISSLKTEMVVHGNAGEAWLEVLSNLFATTPTRLPVDLIAKTFLETTAAQTVALVWQKDGGLASTAWDSPVPNEVLEGYFTDGALLKDHPLFHWYQVTKDPRPTTIARLPDRIVPRRLKSSFAEHFAPWPVEEQLGMPLALGLHQHLAFGLLRTGEDFPDDDVLLLRQVQPMLHALARLIGYQAWADRALEHRHGTALPTDDGLEIPLTGRERAVLALLARGQSAAVIAAELGISERTVHKHLEHCYTKLGVNDRLSAALQARRMRLIP